MHDRPERILLDAGSVCKAVGLPDAPQVWCETWPQSQGSFDPENASLCDPGWYEQACETLRMSEEVKRAVVQAAGEMARDTALRRLVWHCHWMVFDSGIDMRMWEWPVPPPEGSPAIRMLYAMTLMVGLPRVQAIHTVRGIDPEVTAQTLADLELWIREYKRREGVFGFRQIGWLMHHFRGRLFWLARLEFLPGRFSHPFRFYRHSDTRQVVALAEDGLLLRGDGQFADADEGAVREGLWMSGLAITEDRIVGNPVSPRGHILPTELALDVSRWHEILRSGDPVMTVHIPASGPMDPASCGEAFRQAVEFFDQHFPDGPFRAFTCTSWLLDPQFEAMDPPPPNIVDFLRNWYLHPVKGASDHQTWERVFDLHDDSRSGPDEAPQETSLQRAIVGLMRDGGRCRSGGSVLFAEDLDWGNEVYRTCRKAPGLGDD